MLPGFFLGIVAISCENIWEISFQKNEKSQLECQEKKNKGGVKLSKGWICLFQCLQVLDANGWAQKYVPGIPCKENVYNTFMGSSKQMIGYLHHRRALTIIWSWKIVGIKQEINAIYLKIPRLCVK